MENNKIKVVYLASGKNEYLKKWEKGEAPSNALYGFCFLTDDPEIDFCFLNIKKYYQGCFLKKIINKFKLIFKLKEYDVVISHQYLDLLLFKWLVLSKNKWVFLNINLVTVLNSKGGIRCFLLKNLLKKTDLIINLSYFQQNYLEILGLNKTRMEVVKFGVDTKFYQKSLEHKDYILSVGLDLGRDFKTLIEAISLIDENFIIISPQRNFEGINEFPSNLEIINKVDYLNLREYYANARFVVVPSKKGQEIGSDCSGQTVVLEALVSGKPVITSYKKWIEDYNLVDKLIIYETEDSVDLKKKIELLIKNDHLVKELSQKGRFLIKKELNSIKMAKKLKKLLMKNKYKNLIYFQNGSIGDFLMTIFFLENVYLNDSNLKLWVIVPKNEKLLQQFLEKYPYINIILANRKSLKGILGIFSLSRFVFSKNLVITAPTPGKLSLYIKIIAKKISFFGGSELIGFDDRQKINKFIYTKLLKYDTFVIYSELLKKLTKQLGFNIKKEVPKLKYLYNENILEKLNLKEGKYIVFHTQGSSKKRSLKEKEIIKLIEKINQITHYTKIILTGGKADKNVLNIISLLFKNNVLLMINPIVSELCTVIDNSKLFIGVDTGTTHVASFLHKKSLVITHPATTPNWIPYYNSNARILYSINNCDHNIYEGREHLEKCRGDVLRCLEKVPLSVIEESLKELLK